MMMTTRWSRNSGKWRKILDPNSQITTTQTKM